MLLKHLLVQVQVIFIISLSYHLACAQESDCPSRLWPAQFGGPANAIVNQLEAEKWYRYKQKRSEEALLEAKHPQQAQLAYKLEMQEILSGCVSVPTLVDLGRALFLRRFSRTEGYGHGLKEYPARSRFQHGHFGGPDASACVDCHWKGGFAGSGDRVDNTYAFGDGNSLSLAEARNPPALWGVGWVQIIATEMSAELNTIRQQAVLSAQTKNQTVKMELISKGVSFGSITVQAQGQIDYTELEGIDQDLVVKPFGWRGVFKTLREFVEISAQKHLGLQSEYLVQVGYPEVELGTGPKSDPDQDEVLRELSEGQVTALVTFLATLDSPQVELPTHGLYQVPPKIGPLEFIDTPAFVDRWQKGSVLFEQIGCAHCHQPLMAVNSPIFKSEWFDLNTQSSSAKKASFYEIDLSQWAARPHPEIKQQISQEIQTKPVKNKQANTQKQWLVPVFSDFKRHRMGQVLKGLYTERGVSADTYLTRRLWGLRKTSPYLHHGGAITFEEAIKAHGSEGSEAKEASEYYFSLNDDEKSSIRLFLSSLSRGPAIRIR